VRRGWKFATHCDITPPSNFWRFAVHAALETLGAPSVAHPFVGSKLHWSFDCSASPFTSKEEASTTVSRLGADTVRTYRLIGGSNSVTVERWRVAMLDGSGLLWSKRLCAERVRTESDDPLIVAADGGIPKLVTCRLKVERLHKRLRVIAQLVVW